MTKLYAKRLVEADAPNVGHWVFYAEGELSTPICVLTDYAVLHLVRLINEQIPEPAQGAEE